MFDTADRLDAAPRTAFAAPSLGGRRLEALFDPRSCTPLGRADEDGVALALGRIDGASAVAWAQDPSHKGRSLGARRGALIARALATADQQGIPVVGLVESGGARVHEGAAALSAYASIVRAQARCSVPQVAIICGTCAGGGAYSPALGDVTIVVEGSAQMFLTGPRAVQQAIEVIHRKAIAAGADADALAREYEEVHLTAERAVAVGAIDRVIEPHETRLRLIEALSAGAPVARTRRDR